VTERSAGRRVAVITGASSGIGAALAKRLARDGWLPVLLARRRERLEALADETGGDYEVCDVSDREAVEHAGAAVLERHPAVSLLVNNAGIPGRADFLSVDAQRIETVMRVNYLGSVWCLRAFMPGLEAARPADVVNVVSVAGTVALPGSGPYASSKHAQLAFSRATAASLRRRGIRVHAILPGFAETEGFPQRARLRSPLARRAVISAEDVAESIVELIGTHRVERFVPGWYRGFALAQALAPETTARLASRFFAADRPRRASGP
jgi:NAD(P)-dependent dehydrogenase (short-subunit alcohol dehydrogenase family)